jgi:DNA helicase-2/ATP-dependent DNA helicase PcrA
MPIKNEIYRARGGTGQDVALARARRFANNVSIKAMVTLNPEQRQAVEHGAGPLLVIAGPGSGKTRVITERIVHLLEITPHLQPENILALTFTDKAAGEMKRRVRESLPEMETAPFIATFHAFCYHVLRERHFERQLLDKVDVWIFLRRRMEQLGLEFYQRLAEPGAFLHDLNDFFSRCQDELIGPEEFDGFVQKSVKNLAQQARIAEPAERLRLEQEAEKKLELARVFRASRQLLEAAGRSSLGSVIPEAVRLFDREPDVLSRYRARFRYVLVDEFQDTNFAQVELLRRLVAPPSNITAVGDDDQAIYRFRGAAHGAFKMFGQAFPGHQTIYLNRNYRSTRKILRAAEVVIAKNDRYVQKPKLKTEEEEGQPVYLLQSSEPRSEAFWVAEEIARLASRGIKLGEVAVLYRAHTHRDLLVEEFRRRKMPFAIRGLSVLSTVIIRDLVAYLRLVDSPHDNISLTRVLVSTAWRFPEELAFEIRRDAAKSRSSLYDALLTRERPLFASEVKATGWPELKKFLSDLKHFAARAPVTSLFDELISRLGLAFLPSDPDQSYVNAFRNFLAEWEKNSETRRLAEFMEYFQYFVEAGGKIEAPEPAEASGAIQMMTVHAAKGLEFPVVFILSVSPRRFPHPEKKPVIEFPDELRKGPEPPADIHLQEERRLFYVGTTRAEQRLYVSSVGKHGRKPSVFVEDLLSDPAVRARDVERIEVPDVPPDEPKVPAPTRVHAASQAARQRGLFEEPVDSGRVYPPLAEWAARPPALDPDGKLRLSATAIEDYLSCPLKFKFNHFLRIPTGPQPALTFGNIMHSCVRHYFKLRRNNVPGFEEVEAFYLASWKGAGFEDSYQEQTYKKAGIEQLRLFVGDQNARPVAADGVKMEQHFALDLDDVVLEGRIDQINPLGLPTGESGHAPARRPPVELVDYKTGKPRSQKDADKSLQLSVYALAARHHLGLEPERLTFYNLTNNQPVSSVRTEKDLEEARRQVGEVAAEIRRLLFPPTPGFVCKFCDFVPICPAHEERF